MRAVMVEGDGPVTVEAYTVAHRGGEPRVGLAACLTAAGQRTWGTVDDSAVMEAMMREEFCGRPGRIDGHGKLGVD